MKETGLFRETWVFSGSLFGIRMQDRKKRWMIFLTLPAIRCAAMTHSATIFKTGAM
jgi:hypothetical protein